MERGNDMWESNISAGCVTMCALLISGMATIVAGGLMGAEAVGQMGVVVACIGLTMMIVRDNQRTRRMLRRPGEQLGPMRAVPPVD